MLSKNKYLLLLLLYCLCFLRRRPKPSWRELEHNTHKTRIDLHLSVSSNLNNYHYAGIEVSSSTNMPDRSWKMKSILKIDLCKRKSRIGVFLPVLCDAKPSILVKQRPQKSTVAKIWKAESYSAIHWCVHNVQWTKSIPFLRNLWSYFIIVIIYLKIVESLRRLKWEPMELENKLSDWNGRL